MKYKITPLFSSFWRISMKSQASYVSIGSFRLKNKHLTILNLHSSRLSLITKGVSRLVKISIANELLQIDAMLKKTPCDKIIYYKKGLPNEQVILCQKKGNRILIYHKDVQIAFCYPLGRAFVLNLNIDPPPIPKSFILAATFPFLN